MSDTCSYSLTDHTESKRLTNATRACLTHSGTLRNWATASPALVSVRVAVFRLHITRQLVWTSTIHCRKTKSWQIVPAGWQRTRKPTRGNSSCLEDHSEGQWGYPIQTCPGSGKHPELFLLLPPEFNQAKINPAIWTARLYLNFKHDNPDPAPSFWSTTIPLTSKHAGVFLTPLS